MKKMMCAILLATAVAAGCDESVYAEDYFYVEVGVSRNINDYNWIGDYPASIAFGYMIDKDNYYVKGEITHLSNLEKGPPFNNEYESYLDRVGVYFGYKFK